MGGDVATISGRNGTVTGYSRPNLIGDPHSACTINGVSVPTGTITCFYNPAAFSVPSRSFGNLGKDVLRLEPTYNRVSYPRRSSG